MTSTVPSTAVEHGTALAVQLVTWRLVLCTAVLKDLCGRGLFAWPLHTAIGLQMAHGRLGLALAQLGVALLRHLMGAWSRPPRHGRR